MLNPFYTVVIFLIHDQWFHLVPCSVNILYAQSSHNIKSLKFPFKETKVRSRHTSWFSFTMSCQQQCTLSVALLEACGAIFIQVRKAPCIILLFFIFSVQSLSCQLFLRLFNSNHITQRPKGTNRNLIKSTHTSTNMVCFRLFAQI